MANPFKKLMRIQVQEHLNDFTGLEKRSIPKKGWIKTIREALGMTSNVLADRLGTSQANIIAMEKREQKRAITLEKLDQAARAMNCKLVYCLIPLESSSLDNILEKQARKIAQKRIKVINHSMSLEKQGLTTRQLKKQEDDLVQELLQADPKKLWVSE